MTGTPGYSAAAIAAPHSTPSTRRPSSEVLSAPPTPLNVDDVWSPADEATSTPFTQASSVDNLEELNVNNNNTTNPTTHVNGAYNKDIAIIGVGLRTAGGNTTPEQLWQFLLDKKDASGEVPAHRWEPWYRRDVRNAKEIEKTLRRGYFIPDLENFDAAFFGISPKEAEQMDPHQRLGLELSWEALEHAGIDAKALAGSDTAVFMGVDSDDYSRLLLEDLPNIEAHTGIGTAPHGIPNRISYHLDLMGPSVAVDAACASSLAAVHMGRQAIVNGESKLAIVGGVQVLLAPALTRMLGKAGALSPEGVCRSFDDAANGYVRGEGGAVLVLKGLDDALADGDNVLAVLKGSAIAQDGKTNGIMAPNAKAQELVARQALSRAGIDPLTVGYVEAHATSTKLGDPTEVSAIAAVYGAKAGRPADAPVPMGSIKPNVGHMEAAAGAIGLIKAALTVQKGQLAPQANLDKLNSRIDWENSGLGVVREASEWKNANGLPRRAAVCSYGYGGTVSHAVIEQAPPSRSGGIAALQQITGPVILTVSAFQEKRLPKQASALAEWLTSPEGRTADLRAVANTLAHRRAHHDYRAAIMAESHDAAIEALKKLASGSTEGTEHMSIGRALGSGAHISTQAVWVFSGHGAQWKTMGKELLKNSVFAQAIASLEIIVQREANFSAIQALETGDFMESSERIQILTYIMQVGLTQVLRSKGLEPQAVIGHSVGEIAASVAAGCLTAEEGALVVIRRAKLYAKVREQVLGGMALVNLPFATVAAELAGRADLVAAIDSSPTTCVVSGEAGAVEAYTAELKLRDPPVKTFRVKTDVAFHSPMLDQIVTPLEDALNGSLHPRSPTVPIYSTSNKDPRSDAPRDVEYWVNNMVSPVHLRSAVNAAADDGHRIFVEISSHPIVLHSVNETVSERSSDNDEFVTISTLKRDSHALQNIQQTVAQLWTKGAPIDLDAQFGHRRLWQQAGVPGTQWFHKPHIRQVETGSAFDVNSVHDVEKHTLLGQRTAVAGTDVVVFSTKLDDTTKPFPGTHPLDGTEIIPAAVYINTFHHATGAKELEDIQLRVPVSMGKDTRNVQIIVKGEDISVASSATPVKSVDGKEPEHQEVSWVSHSSARWSKTHASNIVEQAAQKFDIQSIKARIGTILPNSFSVDYLTKIGVAGIAFPWQVIEHYGNAKEMMVKVDNDPSIADDKASTYPTWSGDSWAPMLDAATSVGSTIFFADPKLRIVSGIDRVSLISTRPLPKIGYLYVEEAADEKSPAANVSVLDEDGVLLAKFTSMRFSEVEGARGASGSVDSLVHRLTWVPPKFRERPRAVEHVVLVSADVQTRAAYATQLLLQKAKTVLQVGSAAEAGTEEYLSVLRQKGSILVYVPHSVNSLADVAATAEEFTWEVTSLTKLLAKHDLASGSTKLFVLTNRVYVGDSVTGIAHGALYGLARIIAAEHPDLWGGLIDNETPAMFPLLPVKYVDEVDVIRMVDGLPRRAIMRPLLRDQRHGPERTKTLLPKPEGTYIVAGGLGDLGLETLSWLVSKGARRIVAVSRGGLPPRRTWKSGISNPKTAAAVQRIQELEKSGASIHALALDITAPNAAEQLLDRLDELALPPVLGVVHAAGILEDSLVLDTTKDSFARVLAPKIRGALALHQAFPPATNSSSDTGGGLDFFVLYSSIGQLVGTAGQASYGSGNAFLDALATYRRARGDNAVALAFTAVRGLGMATSTEFLTVELQSKGITDVSAAECFRAWEHVDRFDVDGVVVTRCLAVDEGEPAALPLLEDVVVRRPKAAASGGDSSSPASGGAASEENGPGGAEARPTDPKALAEWLGVRIRECIAAVLMIPDIEDVDPRTPVADLGVDSVMTVALRQKLQGALKVKVPPTLTWNHPTVNHLVPWFVAKFTEKE